MSYQNLGKTKELWNTLLNPEIVDSLLLEGGEDAFKLFLDGMSIEDFAKNASKIGIETQKIERLLDNVGVSGDYLAQIMASIGTTGTKSFKNIGQILRGFVLSPLGKIAIAVAAVAGALALLDWAITTPEELEEKLNNLNAEYEELSSNINSVASNFRSLKSSADDIIPRFVELSKGVNQFGKNVSLTDEEYDEFISLNNRIAEMFPSINAGMDSNGNAILSLSYNANTLTDSLYRLVDAQKQAANQEIANAMPDVVDNVRETISALEAQRSRYQNVLDTLANAESAYRYDELQRISSLRDAFNVAEKSFPVYIKLNGFSLYPGGKPCYNINYLIFSGGKSE